MIFSSSVSIAFWIQWWKTHTNV